MHLINHGTRAWMGIIPNANMGGVRIGEMYLPHQLLSIFSHISACQFCIQFKGRGSMPPLSS